MKRIVCFHLFNDYSGSPKVLKTVLEGWLERGRKIDLISSKGGVLDELRHYDNLSFTAYSYRFSPHPLLTMVRYMGVQIYTFFWSFHYLFRQDTLFYINTLLPAGPALAGWLMRKRVIYHYHENAVTKSSFYRFLSRWMETFASEIVCVSEYQRAFLKTKKKVTVIPNSVPDDFVKRLHPSPADAFERKRILMLGSLKAYKGTLEFIQLAQRMPQFTFELVINDTQENIDNFVSAQTKMPDNLTLFARQSDVAVFYNRVSLVLNLSNKELFVETFGLTALEAMSAGLPVIVPTVGGIAELVEDGVNGYKIDVQELGRVARTIETVLTNKELYLRLAGNALKYSVGFDCRQMQDRLMAVLGPRADFYL